MGLFRNSDQSKDEAKAATTKYRAAKKALHDNQEREEQTGIRDETPEFRRLNRAVLDAEKNVPWIFR